MSHHYLYFPLMHDLHNRFQQIFNLKHFPLSLQLGNIWFFNFYTPIRYLHLSRVITSEAHPVRLFWEGVCLFLSSLIRYFSQAEFWCWLHAVLPGLLLSLLLVELGLVSWAGTRCVIHVLCRQLLSDLIHYSRDFPVWLHDLFLGLCPLEFCRTTVGPGPSSNI